MHQAFSRMRERLFPGREIAADALSSISATLLYPPVEPLRPAEATPLPRLLPATPVTLITHEGGLLAFDPITGQLVQRSLADTAESTLCWHVEDGRVELLEAGSGHLVLEAEQVADGDGWFGLQLADGAFLCASPHLGPVSAASAELLAWERLMALTPEDLALLRLFSARRWLIDDDERPTDRETVTLEPGFKLGFGGRECSIRALLLALHEDGASRHPSGLPMSFVFFHDICTPARALLFEPLIYSTVCGSDYFFEQHALCVRSIERSGGYDGSYLLVSDRDEASASAAFANIDASRWVCLKQDLSNADRLAAARRDALRHDSFVGYQPLLYLDSDVICDAPVEALLTAAARAERLLISAEFPGLSIAQVGVPHGNWFGGFLYEQGDNRVSVDRCINSGIFAGRNRDRLDDALSLVGRAWALFRQVHGEAHKAAFDQPFFSYVLQRLSLADIEPMERWVTILNGNEPGDENVLKGLMHFNIGVGLDKTAAMRRYLERLGRTAAPELAGAGAAAEPLAGAGFGRQEEMA